MIVYILVISGIFACSASQLLLKSSAEIVHHSIVFEILNIRVIIAYSILFCSLLVNVWAMGRGVQLKEMALLESLGFIFVPFLAWLVLGERLGKRTIMAIVLILFGILVFNLK